MAKNTAVVAAARVPRVAGIVAVAVVDVVVAVEGERMQSFDTFHIAGLSCHPLPHYHRLNCCCNETRTSPTGRNHSVKASWTTTVMLTGRSQ